MSFIPRLWNRLIDHAPRDGPGVAIGHYVVDGEVSGRTCRISDRSRVEHIVILGKTGTGKTSLIKRMIADDVQAGRGFLCIDLHGDLTPFVLGCIAQKEADTGIDLSSRLVIFDPADPHSVTGTNLLRADGSTAALVSEIVAILRSHWQLDRFGARTEELLRNSLWVLIEHTLTLTELSPFLTDLAVRAPLVNTTRNAEVQSYFRSRFEQLSDAMQTVYREAILNKVSAFTTDPAIRQMVGHTEGINLRAAMDEGRWIVLHATKAVVGTNAETLAALLLCQFRAALFMRQSRSLFSLYADEVQNLLSSSELFAELLAEARKFGVSLVTANQHFGQYPAGFRASLLSAGTLVFFRASSEDAPLIARALSGTTATETTLKELPNRHFLIRSGDSQVRQAKVATVGKAISPGSLALRSAKRWGRKRAEVESEIAGRLHTQRKEALEAWR